MENMNHEHHEHHGDHHPDESAGHQKDHHSQHHEDHPAGHQMDAQSEHHSDHPVEHQMEHHSRHQEDHPADHKMDHHDQHHDAHSQQDDHVTGSGHSMSHVDHSGHEMMFKQRFWWSLLLSVPVLFYSPLIQKVLNYTAPTFPGSNWIPFIFSLVIFGYGGIPFLKMAVPEIRNRKPGMMTLISLAISVALVYSVLAQLTNLGEGFFWELVTLIDIMLLGHWLEMRSVRQASGALNELAKLLPDTAERIQKDGSVETVSVSALQSGDLLLVRPGASVPADGEVTEGESEVNESMITGESKPVTKSPESRLIAGTINGEGSLRLKVTATGDETALAGIMRLVEQAQQSKSNTQLLADKAAGWLFYIALSVATLTAIIWIIAVGFNADVLKRVVTVLVIACPHALGLAVPLVVAITTSMGANNGILIRDRLALEEARKLDTVIFDKTGTLTQGKFTVVDQFTKSDWKSEDALSLAASIEGDSEHLIAKAIVDKAQEAGGTLPHTSGFSAIKGRGVKATNQDRPYYVGGPRLLEMLELTLSENFQQFTNSAGDKSQTVVYLTTEKDVISAFAIADGIRPKSKLAIEKLHQSGIQVAMLTGDSQAVADSVARELGIDTVFAEVLPQDKDKKVIEFQQQGKKVAFVGDGVNDAPALTRADIGIAIGGGTDVAIESAGLILVKSNPLDVVTIIHLSRISHRKMVQNLWWVAGYNIIALPLAAGVLAPLGILISPAFGALLMSLSTIIVAINAQLLRNEKLTFETDIA